MKKGGHMEKKGSELSLNFIIIAILAVIVLIGIVFFFLGGAEFFAKKEKGTLGVTEQELSLAEAACKLHCSLGNKGKWDAPTFSQDVQKTGITDCKGLMDALAIKGQPTLEWNADCAKNA